MSPAPLDVILTWLGAFLGITAIALFAHKFDLPVVASFGASAVLIYGVPDAPLSQPRNVIFGHTFSAVVGVATFHFGYVPNHPTTLLLDQCFRTFSMSWRER